MRSLNMLSQSQFVVPKMLGKRLKYRTMVVVPSIRFGSGQAATLYVSGNKKLPFFPRFAKHEKTKGEPPPAIESFREWEEEEEEEGKSLPKWNKGRTYLGKGDRGKRSVLGEKSKEAPSDGLPSYIEGPQLLVL